MMPNVIKSHEDVMMKELNVSLMFVVMEIH